MEIIFKDKDLEELIAAGKNKRKRQCFNEWTNKSIYNASICQRHNRSTEYQFSSL